MDKQSIDSHQSEALDDWYLPEGLGSSEYEKTIHKGREEVANRYSKRSWLDFVGIGNVFHSRKLAVRRSISHTLLHSSKAALGGGFTSFCDFIGRYVRRRAPGVPVDHCFLHSSSVTPVENSYDGLRAFKGYLAS